MKKKMKNEKWKKKKKKTLKESKCHVFVKQIVFFTVNHRGPLPLRELHSTDETLAWRDPRGSWACLRPVYHYGWNHPISVKKSHVEEKKEKAVFLSSKRSKTTKKNSWVDKDLANKQKTWKMFWRERSCIECYKEQNHYELSGRRPKQIPYEKKKRKNEKEKKRKRHLKSQNVMSL